MRMPLVTKGDCGSSGTLFLLAVSPAASSASEATSPVSPVERRSTNTIGVSVPPVTTVSPRSMRRAANALAFSRTAAP